MLDYTRTKTIERELLLAKISILGPEYFEDQLHNKTGILAATEGLEEGSPAMEHVLNTRAAAAAGHPNVSAGAEVRQKISPSEALRQKHTHLAGIQLLASSFGGKIVDMSNDAVIVEISGKTSRVGRPFSFRILFPGSPRSPYTRGMCSRMMS